MRVNPGVREHRRPASVAVTGLGMVTPLGMSAPETWRAMLEGRSGIRRITKFDPACCLTQYGGELPAAFYEWERTTFPKRLYKQTVRTSRLVLKAAEEAIQDSGVDLEAVDLERCGVVIGTSGSSIRSPHDAPEPGAEKFKIIREMINALPAWVSLQRKFQGPSYTVSAACASGSYAVAHGFDLIRSAIADVVVVGGADTLLTENTIQRGNFLQVLSRENHPEAMRPFDLRRTGFLLADGGCCLVLESSEHAKARGARIYAYLAGYGTVSEAYNIFMPAPHGEAMARAMQAAVAHAGLPKEAIGLICANGTATIVNDYYETQAIKQAFGAHAYRLLVPAVKSMIGHTVGASGAIAVSVAALALHSGCVPPTINYRTPDPDCDLNYVPNHMVTVSGLKAALVNAFGFGGHNCSLVLTAAEPNP
uniref:Beta-ketoacyl-[acyl-carrier-protein] synthase family protein n=1 Tax=Desulfacinum infernum TaxID=35837 RepID=A0A832A321_9BACT